MRTTTTSLALRATVDRLWDGNACTELANSTKARYCCYAAELAGVYLIVAPILEGLLGGAFTLGLWLRRNHPSVNLADTIKMQATRKAWLEHLIEHYESLGD